MPPSDAKLPEATPTPADVSLPPAGAAAVRRLRGPRATVDPLRPIAVWDEWEVAAAGRQVASRVMLLAGAECRFTCAMCDLWRHTLDGPTPPGSLPEQVREGLAAPGRLGLESPAGPSPRWIKLYNGSNFFDTRSVPTGDLPAIARAVAGWDRVVVENHPRLTGPAAARFRDAIDGRLEVAMGLETVHPQILPWLGKQMTAADFAAASGRLRDWGIDVRGFVLLGLPGLTEEESIDWCLETVAFAARAGVRHVSIIPSRSGNGFFDALADRGLFAPPSAAAVERTLARAIGGPCQPACAETLVTVDLWGFESLAGHCPACRDARRRRLAAINLAQRLPAADDVVGHAADPAADPAADHSTHQTADAASCGCLRGGLHDA